MAIPLVSKGDFLRLDRRVLEQLRGASTLDLILATLSVDAEMMMHGYRAGIFAMPVPADDTRPEVYAWYLPELRGVIPIPPGTDGWLGRPPRSLRKSMSRFTLSINRDFAAVLGHCSRLPREGGWINPALETAYSALHARGLALSVEAWTLDGALAGGLFAIRVEDFMAGESMFHLRPDASKAALVALVELAGSEGIRFVDTQWPTDHLRRMGAVEVNWRAYLDAIEGKQLGG